jgi:hypothetical protein
MYMFTVYKDMLYVVLLFVDGYNKSLCYVMLCYVIWLETVYGKFRVKPENNSGGGKCRFISTTTIKSTL